MKPCFNFSFNVKNFIANAQLRTSLAMVVGLKLRRLTGERNDPRLKPLVARCCVMSSICLQFRRFHHKVIFAVSEIFVQTGSIVHDFSSIPCNFSHRSPFPSDFGLYLVPNGKMSCTLLTRLYPGTGSQRNESLAL